MLEVLSEVSPSTDLARLVERVGRNDLPWVAVSSSALAAWESRDPRGWKKVREWLASKGVTIVRI